MKTVLVKETISAIEHQELETEFPQFRILVAPDKDQTPEVQECDWGTIEVVYCSEWKHLDIKKLSALRWIHFTSPQALGLRQPYLEGLPSPLVTTTRDLNGQPFIEYVLGATLAFSKNLLSYYHHKNRDAVGPTTTLQQKKALLISPGRIGSRVAKELRSLGMTVWGIQERRTFHPHCHRMFPGSELRALIPAVDLVYLYYEELAATITTPISAFEMMRPGSILVLIGAGEHCDFATLAKIATTGNLRGIIIDTHTKIPPHAKEILDKAANVVITPGIAALPGPSERLAFRTFLYNLRLFDLKLFEEMRNLSSLSPGRRGGLVDV